MPPTIGLGLIARDEEAALPRLLASCAGAFDEIVLVDTGSTDATMDVFRSWAGEHPETNCRLLEAEWTDDFGAARQIALEALTTDWCSWADCDDEIRGASALRPAASGCDAATAGLTARYDYAPSEHARHVRLVRRGRGRWHGAVHEALEVDGPVAAMDGDEVRWVHLPVETGEPKPRMRRDLEILEGAVAADPDDERALFYLAQTLRDLGERSRAVARYERRAEMDGWDEETFFARYQAGVLLADDDWPRAMQHLVAAWELRPQRVEPLQALSANLRVRGQYETAHVFATRGLGRPQPPDSLFVANWVYAWGMLFEVSITSYWVGEFSAALAACDELLARDDLPGLQRGQTEHNRRVTVNALARRAVGSLASAGPGG